MLVVRYAKVDGGEFISHLDTLRHLQKTFLRGRIPVEYSKGFNPHMLIYMSAPLGVGIKSRAEFFVAETPMSAAEFLPVFNAFAPKTIVGLEAYEVDKRPNIQHLMNSAEYEIYGINPFDVQEILALSSLTAKDKRGEEKEIRDKIIDLKFEDNRLIATLSFGNNTLRPDVLGEKLLSVYGGGPLDIIKTEAMIDGKSLKECFSK